MWGSYVKFSDALALPTAFSALPCLIFSIEGAGKGEANEVSGYSFANLLPEASTSFGLMVEPYLIGREIIRSTVHFHLKCMVVILYLK